MGESCLGIVTGANLYLHSFSLDGRWLAVTLPSELAEKWGGVGNRTPASAHPARKCPFRAEFAPDSRTFVTEATAAGKQTWLDTVLVVSLGDFNQMRLRQV